MLGLGPTDKHGGGAIYGEVLLQYNAFHAKLSVGRPSR